MLGFPSSARPRMLVVALFAVLLNLLAGSGSAIGGMSLPSGFRPELCLGRGSTGPDPAGNPPQIDHDCCTPCAAGTPPVLPKNRIAVPPAPTPGGVPDVPGSAAPGQQPASAHRPRGPPIVA